MKGRVKLLPYGTASPRQLQGVVTNSTLGIVVAVLLMSPRMTNQASPVDKGNLTPRDGPERSTFEQLYLSNKPCQEESARAWSLRPYWPSTLPWAAHLPSSLAEG
jgi:hypothetical protein